MRHVSAVGPACALAVAACSALMLDTASNEAPPSVDPDCDTSVVPILLDAAVVVAAVGATFLQDENRGALIFGALPWAISGRWGLGKVGRCRAAREGHAGWLEDHPPPPPSFDAGVGEERGDCRPGGRCADGLVCASWLCVRRVDAGPDGGSP